MNVRDQLEANMVVSSPRVKRSYSRIAVNEAFWAYSFIFPTMAGLIVFYVAPVFYTFYLSLTRSGDFGKTTFNGIQNYIQMWTDASVWQAFGNTLIYAVLYVPFSIALSIIVAVLLNQKIRGRGFYRTLYFLPVVTAPASIAMVWKWLYNGQYGLINYLLSLVHIHGPNWVSSPSVALYSIIIVGIWGSIGYNMVIFLSGLQGISSSYYEAASIDGASPYVRFFRITLPLLTPTIFFVTVISLIGAFQVFDVIYMMIGPTNPAIQNSESLVYLFFYNAFMTNNESYGAAIATLLFVIILILTILQMIFQKRWVHYE